MSSPGYGKFSVFKSRGAEGQPGSWRSARLKVAFNGLLIYRVDYCPRECYFSPQIFLKNRNKGFFSLRILGRWRRYCGFGDLRGVLTEAAFLFTAPANATVFRSKQGAEIRRAGSRREAWLLPEARARSFGLRETNKGAE